MLIETYRYEGNGYKPFFIRDGWQVAKLNYMPGQGLSDIIKIDKHIRTDEVFILVKGVAVLIAAERVGKAFKFQCLRMKPGITYNIPAGTWHNIAMDLDAEVIIVEKDNTHIDDCIYEPLEEREQLDLYEKVESKLSAL